MTLAVIPLSAVPSQTLSVTLAGQATTIDVNQLSTGLFVDMSVAGVSIVSGQIALNLVRMIRTAYLGFVGDLVFVDTVAASDPDHTGLGGRYQLVYGSEADFGA